jgi:hypothetical protein
VTCQGKFLSFTCVYGFRTFGCEPGKQNFPILYVCTGFKLIGVYVNFRQLFTRCVNILSISDWVV